MERNCLFFMLALVFIACVIFFRGNREEEGEKRDTVSVVEDDTVTRQEIIKTPKHDTIYIVRTVKVPVTEFGDRGQGDSKDTTPSGLKPDSITLPIEQKVYTDSSYTAWVSGYLPQLDSIVLHKKYVFRTITNTVTITKKTPKWSVGITGGAGVGILHRQPDVFIGIGINYRLWPP